MTGPGGAVDATLSAIENASAPMSAAHTELQAFGDALGAAAAAAGGAAGGGDLGVALDEFGEKARKRAHERGDECGELSQALMKSVDGYRHSDSQAAAQLRGVSFGGVTG